ncbi:unnamed protein product [Closterium sp. NIES-65]|nr:unnamed protein product [Closterium sp. NIES-65]
MSTTTESAIVQSEEDELFREGCAFEGAAVVALVKEDGGIHVGGAEGGEGGEAGEGKAKTMEIMLDDGVLFTLELDSGEKRLMELGYTQDLQRSMVRLYNATAYLNGGPVCCVWFWWITAFFAHLLALSFAEIASSFPTAGSLYFWAAALAGPKYGPFAAWITGWLEFVGLSVGVGGVAFGGMMGVGGVAFGGIQQIMSLVLLATGGWAAPTVADTPSQTACSGSNSGGYTFPDYLQFLACVALILMCAAINVLPIKRVGQVLAIGTVLQILVAFVFIITLPAVAKTHQPASWVFGHFEVQYSITGIPNGAYAVVAGLLMSQYALYAFDAAAHTSEEAKRSDVTTPFAMIAALSVICFVEWGVIVALTFCIQDPENLLSKDTVTGGDFTEVQILWDVFYGRFGSGAGACVFLGLFFTSFFFATITLILAAARVGYALSRDRGLPLSFLWRRVNSSKVPVNAIACTSAIAIIFLMPLLGGSVAYFAVTGMATVGWFGAYGVPVFFRIIQSDQDFAPGPFFLPNYIGHTGGGGLETEGAVADRGEGGEEEGNGGCFTPCASVWGSLSVTHFAVTGMATVGWFGAYGVPVFFRIFQSNKDFVLGPFFLPNYIGHTGGKCVHILALTYVVYTMVVFVIPTEYPVTAENFNYAAVGIVVVVAVFLLWWFLDAHRWFKGPKIAKQEDQVDAKPQEQQEQYQSRQNATAHRVNPDSTHQEADANASPEFSLTIPTHSQPADVAIEKSGDVATDVAADVESDSDEVVSKEAAIGGTLAAGALIVSVVASLALLGYYYKDDISSAIDYFTTYIEGAGSGGYVTFVLGYSLLEVLAVPAIPLTLSAGVLFGPVMGTFLCSLSGTISATIAFLIARYVARDRIQDMVRGNKKYEAIDRAVGNNSFRIVTLLRLSPLMPFSLGNYFYGLTSVKLLPYIFGTWIGMLPGTWAYVSAGSFGRSLLEAESGSSLLGDSSLYSLLGGVALTAFAATYITKIVQDAVKEAE